MKKLAICLHERRRMGQSIRNGCSSFHIAVLLRLNIDWLRQFDAIQTPLDPVGCHSIQLTHTLHTVLQTAHGLVEGAVLDRTLSVRASQVRGTVTLGSTPHNARHFHETETQHQDH